MSGPTRSGSANGSDSVTSPVLVAVSMARAIGGNNSASTPFAIDIVESGSPNETMAASSDDSAGPRSGSFTTGLVGSDRYCASRALGTESAHAMP